MRFCDVRVVQSGTSLRDVLRSQPENIQHSGSRNSPLAANYQIFRFFVLFNRPLQLVQPLGPRWPLQIPPPVATQTPPGRTGKLSVFRVVWGWSPRSMVLYVFFGFNLNGCLASEARQAVGIGRGAVGRPQTP